MATHQQQPGMFNVIAAADVEPERDVFVVLPTEAPPNKAGGNNKQPFHRVPIRSACTESAGGDRRVRVQLVDGHRNVVASAQGLQRLLLRFPRAYVPGVKVFEGNNDGDRTNLSMGFSLYDYRTGPTPEEQQVLGRIDTLADWLRRTIVGCNRIRRTLKLGPDHMDPQQQRVAADMMDLHVARPAVERSGGKGGGAGRDGGGYGGSTASGQTASSAAPASLASRYCYVKLVPPDPAVNEIYHTYFWTLDGRRIPFEAVVAFRNFHVQPFVEMEDIFVSKAVRSLQLKLRECIVIPPAERMQSRFSVCFPERVCKREEEDEVVVPVADEPLGGKRPPGGMVAVTEEEPPAKRPHHATVAVTAAPSPPPPPPPSASPAVDPEAVPEDDDDDGDAPPPAEAE